MLGIFLDSEANGLNCTIHKLIEIAFIIVDLTTGEKKEVYQSIVSHTKSEWEKSDPMSLQVNGFTWEEVALGKPKERVGQEIISIFSDHAIERKKAVFICQNPSFDRVFFGQLVDPSVQETLRWPYHWLDLASMHWALTLKQAKENKGPYPWETGLSKDMIAAFHRISPEEKPHRAMNGAAHLLKCYETILGYPSK